MDYHAFLPFQTFTMKKIGVSSSGQLEAGGASGSGRLVVAADPSNTSGRTVHIQSNTDGLKHIGKFDDLASRRARRSTNFFNRVSDSIFD